jgi:hypothetical protein
MTSDDETAEKEQDHSALPGLDLFTHNLELAATVLLAVAAIMTAWAGFESAKWGGVQATLFSEAGANRTESTRFSTFAGQQAQVDISTFTNWLNAVQADSRAGDIAIPASAAEYQPTPGTLSGFLFDRFRDEFAPAVTAWLNTDPFADPNAPPSPLDMPEYELAAQQDAIELQDKADQAAQEARDANQTSDDYVITAVMAALVLFFAGISSKMDRPRNRIILLTLAVIVLVGTLARIVSLPIEI